LFYFFFSSRRRHTRFSRDWSSDVCSSDLVIFQSLQVQTRNSYLLLPEENLKVFPEMLNMFCNGLTSDNLLIVLCKSYSATVGRRSEERRVGKECRCRCVSVDLRKK